VGLRDDPLQRHPSRLDRHPGTNHGKADIYLDGVLVVEALDLYARASWYQQKVWSSGTLRVVTTRSGSSATRTAVRQYIKRGQGGRGRHLGRKHPGGADRLPAGLVTQPLRLTSGSSSYLSGGSTAR